MIFFIYSWFNYTITMTQHFARIVCFSGRPEYTATTGSTNNTPWHSESQKAFPAFHLEQLPASLGPLQCNARRKESPHSFRQISSGRPANAGCLFCLHCIHWPAHLHQAMLSVFICSICYAVSLWLVRSEEQCFAVFAQFGFAVRESWSFSWPGQVSCWAIFCCCLRQLKGAFNWTGQIIGPVVCPSDVQYSSAVHEFLNKTKRRSLINPASLFSHSKKKSGIAGQIQFWSGL